jgi:hypothetical protein
MLALVLGATLAAATPEADRAAADAKWSRERSLCGGLVRAEGAPPPRWLPETAAEARAVMWDRRYDLAPPCLYEASALWLDADDDKAAKLQALARIRARYDMMRCKTPETARGFPSLAQGWELSVNYKLARTPSGEPAAFARLTKEVLADDATFEYRSELEAVCRDAGGVSGRGAWGGAKNRLRAALK